MRQSYKCRSVPAPEYDRFGTEVQENKIAWTIIRLILENLKDM